MKLRTLGATLAVCVAMLPFATPASAAFVTSLPGGTAIPIPGLNLVTTSSTAIGGGITFSSNVPGGSLLGGTDAANFGNGTFGPGDPYIALLAGSNGPSYASMFLTFATPTSGFIGDFRWINQSFEAVSANVDIFDSDGNQLESKALNNNGQYTGIGPGLFGFLRDTADIKTVRFSNDFMAVRDLQYIGPVINNGGAVPEPDAWAMMLLGFGFVGSMVRKRSNRRVPGHGGTLMLKKAAAISAAWVAFLTTGTAAQAGVIDVTDTITGSTGAWIHDFSVTNNMPDNIGPDTNNVYFFGVAIAGGTLAGTPSPFVHDVAAWTFTPFGVGSSTVYNNTWNWPGDVGFSPGLTVSGFKVLDTGSVAQASVNWFAFSYHGDAYTAGPYLATNAAGNLNPGFEGVVTTAGAGVPEPMTWALMLMGFGGLGAMLRRQRRQGIAALA